MKRNFPVPAAFLFTLTFIFLFAGSFLFTRNCSADVFKDGQKICFYGDSITHGGHFHYMIYDYYLTRFPTSTIAFFNAGVAGDNAGAAMTRIEEDVFSQKPDVVVLMFGMNDVGRGFYVANPSKDLLNRQRVVLDRYEQNMIRLADALQNELNPHFIFITPSIFDHTGLNDRNNNQPGCNDGLGKCAEIVKKLAADLTPKKAAGSVEVVDFHAPMTEFNAKMQKNDPYYTIVGPDRVHPGAPGHLMMAWLFLKEQGAPALVSEVVLDGESVVKAENAAVSNLRKTESGLTCTILEKALPFPIDAGAYPLLKELPIAEDLNREIFSVKNLAAGQYELLIDGKTVGTYSAEELSAGINLAMNDQTPQFQQAQNVRALGQERRATEVILRNYAAVRWYLRRWVNPDDLPAVQKYYDEKITNRTGYFESKVPTYLKEWPNRGEVQRKLAEQTDELLKARLPQAHEFEIRPAK